MGGVETPADAGRGDPLLDAGELVVVEVEAPAHRVEAGEVDELGRRDPASAERQQLGERAEDGVGLAQRAVGEADLQVRQGRDVGGLGASSSTSARRRTWRGRAGRTSRCPGTSR